MKGEFCLEGNEVTDYYIRSVSDFEAILISYGGYPLSVVRTVGKITYKPFLKWFIIYMTIT